MMPKFRKRPVVIEAIQFRAGEQPGEFSADVIAGRVRYPEDGSMLIQTLEGVICASPGDWIIRGVKGELYPCKPDIFAASYEPADVIPAIDVVSYDTEAARLAERRRAERRRLFLSREPSKIRTRK